MHPVLAVLWGILPTPDDLNDAQPPAKPARVRRVFRVRIIDADRATEPRAPAPERA